MERFSPVFAALNATGSRYVVVGGVAVSLHGYVRGTTDIDLVIDLAPDDARRTRCTTSGRGEAGRPRDLLDMALSAQELNPRLRPKEREG